MGDTVATVVSSSIDRTSAYLLICIDYGSGKLSVICKHVQAGENADDVEPNTIQLLSSEDEQMQRLLLITDEESDRILYGSEVTEHLDYHPEDAPNIIDMLKLALCEPWKTTSAVQRLYAILGVTLGDLWHVQRLLALHLARIRLDILKCYEMDSPAMNLDESYWTTIQLETMITVPAMWDGASRGIMRNAAVEAGFANVRLRLEPLAAAALHMHNYVRWGWIKVSLPPSYPGLGIDTDFV